MTGKRLPGEAAQPSILTVEELEILEELQHMFRQGVQDIPAELIERMERRLKWNHDDPASLRRAAYFATQDPYLRREAAAINTEFGVAQADGLEEY
jgi:hypothetical protein